MGSHQKPQKQTTQAYMAIDNDDAFFALLCVRLHITDIEFGTHATTHSLPNSSLS
jgi:hypothetical protein